MIEHAENQDGKVVLNKQFIMGVREQSKKPIPRQLALYAAAATAGVTGGAASTGLTSSTGAAATSGVDSTAASAAGVSVAGFSRGATGAGSSILGGCSSTFAGEETSDLGFALKNSPTRDDRRRPSFFFSSSFFSSFFSSFSSF